MKPGACGFGLTVLVLSTLICHAESSNQVIIDGTDFVNKLNVDSKVISSDTVPICSLLTLKNMYSFKVQRVSAGGVHIALQLGYRFVIMRNLKVGLEASFVDSSELKISGTKSDRDTTVKLLTSGTELLSAPISSLVGSLQKVMGVYMITKEKVKPKKLGEVVANEMDRKGYPLSVVAPELEPSNALCSFSVSASPLELTDTPTAHVFISTIPPIMTISYMGTVMGKTNMSAIYLMEGTKTYTFEKDGRSYTKEMRLNRGENEPITVVFDKWDYLKWIPIGGRFIDDYAIDEKEAAYKNEERIKRGYLNFVDGIYQERRLTSRSTMNCAGPLVSRVCEEVSVWLLNSKAGTIRLTQCYTSKTCRNEWT